MIACRCLFTISVLSVLLSGCNGTRIDPLAIIDAPFRTAQQLADGASNVVNQRGQFSSNANVRAAAVAADAPTEPEYEGERPVAPANAVWVDIANASGCSILYDQKLFFGMISGPKRDREHLREVRWYPEGKRSVFATASCPDGRIEGRGLVEFDWTGIDHLNREQKYTSRIFAVSRRNRSYGQSYAHAQNGILVGYLRSKFNSSDATHEFAKGGYVSLEQATIKTRDQGKARENVIETNQSQSPLRQAFPYKVELVPGEQRNTSDSDDKSVEADAMLKIEVNGLSQTLNGRAPGAYTLRFKGVLRVCLNAGQNLFSFTECKNVPISRDVLVTRGRNWSASDTHKVASIQISRESREGRFLRMNSSRLQDTELTIYLAEIIE
jgi:hypothetical protein